MGRMGCIGHMSSMSRMDRMACMDCMGAWAHLMEHHSPDPGLDQQLGTLIAREHGHIQHSLHAKGHEE